MPHASSKTRHMTLRLEYEFSTTWEGKGVKYPGFAREGGGGGVLKLRFDRYIMLLIVMPEIALRKSYDHTHGLNHIFFSGYFFFFFFFFFLLTISILPLQYVQIILTIH